MNSGQPALPSNLAQVTPEQRRRYNRWALLNGQAPLPAAPAAAAAAAAAAPPPPAGIIATAVQNGARARFNAARFRWELSLRGGHRYILTNQNGSLTRDGGQYSSVARRMGLDNYELNVWQDGVHMMDGTNYDVAYDVSGTRRVVRRYNAATGQKYRHA